MKKHAIITIGLSGSGKSHFSEQQTGYIEINRDKIRQSIFEISHPNIKFTWKNWDWKNEPQVTNIQRNLIKEASKDNKNIIISDTNLSIKTLNSLTNTLKSLGYNVEYKVIHERLDICLGRDAKRENPVGFKVIGEQYTKYLKMLEYLSPKEPYKQPDTIISDLDGTLFLMNDNRGPFEFDKVHLDNVNFFVRETIKGYNLLGYKIIFVSGRDDSCYQSSFECIKKAFDGKLQFDLYMRKTGDKRGDDIVKKEIYDTHIKPFYSILCVLDDRPKVNLLWDSLGLNVLRIGNPYHWF